MPVIGVQCPYDDTYQSFDHCISCHENRSKERNCHAPVFALKSMRDNHIDRKDAGISISTLISCPREVAIEEAYDVYEKVISGYNKARGSWTHAMIEADRDPPEWIIRERRLFIDIDGVRITGKPDEVDTKYNVLVDYKSKDNLPLRSDSSHEFQFNAYAYLLKKGYWLDTGEAANIDIEVIAGHYLTWKTATERAWKKSAYSVWPLDTTERIIKERLAPIVQWKSTRELPTCSPYQTFPGKWRCHCYRLEEQLHERGITIGS